MPGSWPGKGGLETRQRGGVLSRLAHVPQCQAELLTCPSAPREKACLVDEDSRSSAGTLPGPGASLPSSSGPGLTSPPYTATPIDHDYVKCKKPHQQATPDGTVPVLPTASPGRHASRGRALWAMSRFVSVRGVLGLG